MHTNVQYELTDFFGKYALLRSTDDAVAMQPKDPICRYCMRTRPEVRFRQRTHLVPELLGRNDHFAFDECDSCNGQFGRYERELSTFLLPYRATQSVRGKRGFPQFKSRPVPGVERSELEAGHHPETGLQFTVRTPSDFVVDHEERTGRVTFRVPPFIPLYVYKALLKIGLGLLPPEEIEAHRHSCDWLIGNQVPMNFCPILFVTPIYNRFFTAPSAHLYRAIEEFVANAKYPEYALVIETGNVVIQIFLPFTANLLSVHSQSSNLTLVIYPGFARDLPVSGMSWEVKTHDLSRSDSVTYDVVMNIAFDSIRREVLDQGSD